MSEVLDKNKPPGDEVSSREIFSMFWRAKWLIAAVSLGLAAAGGLGALASQFGGLASLAGVSVPGDSKKYESIAVLQSELITAKYISRSGGTMQKADRKRIYVVRANGDVVSGGRSGWFRRTESVDIRPGDTIVVPLDTERVRGLPLSQSVTTIIYNLAVALLAVRSV
jgi:hypothetical protein